MEETLKTKNDKDSKPSNANITTIIDIADKSFRETYKARMVYGFYERGVREGRVQILQVLKDAWQGRSAPEFLVTIAETAKWYVDEIWDFIAGLSGYQERQKCEILGKGCYLL
jgi:hypothetical protein